MLECHRSCNMKYDHQTRANMLKTIDGFTDCNQLLQLCMARTAWSESVQGVRAVHSCSSW